MLRHNIVRLPVVSADEPRRLVGYLGRTGIMEARLRQHQEENVREHSWPRVRSAGDPKKRLPFG